MPEIHNPIKSIDKPSTQAEKVDRFISNTEKYLDAAVDVLQNGGIIGTDGTIVTGVGRLFSQYDIPQNISNRVLFTKLDGSGNEVLMKLSQDLKTISGDKSITYHLFPPNQNLAYPYSLTADDSHNKNLTIGIKPEKVQSYKWKFAIGEILTNAVTYMFKNILDISYISEDRFSLYFPYLEKLDPYIKRNESSILEINIASILQTKLAKLLNTTN